MKPGIVPGFCSIKPFTMTTKNVWYKLTSILIAASIAFTICGAFIEDRHHKCPFEYCPYKGKTKFDGVINTGQSQVDHSQDGTDTWCIDKLHFEYPNESYDQLENRLFNQSN